MDEHPVEEPEPNDPDHQHGAVERARAQLPDTIDTAKLPAARLPSAAPSAPARGLAFGSILIGGLCGGLIGYAFTDLQCDDGCTAWAGVGAVIGAVAGAVGVALVAVLVLRAMDEWTSVHEEEPGDHPSRRPGTAS